MFYPTITLTSACEVVVIVMHLSVLERMNDVLAIHTGAHEWPGISVGIRNSFKIIFIFPVAMSQTVFAISLYNKMKNMDDVC